MKKLLIVPAFLVAACADNVDPETTQVDVSSEAAPVATETSATDNPLNVGFFTEPNDCSDHSIRIRPVYSYADGTRPENVSCLYTLADGTVLANSCGASPSMEAGGIVTLTLTDLDTGTVGTHTDAVEAGPASFATTLAVTTNGLDLSWDAHNLYGGAVVDSNTRLQISITPSENVIISDPAVLRQPSGTVTVTEAGTYTVRAIGGISFAGLADCGGTAEQTVELTCSGM